MIPDEWAYLFGAVCPQRAVGAAVVLPHVNCEAMRLHLREISRTVAPERIASITQRDCAVVS